MDAETIVADVGGVKRTAVMVRPAGAVRSVLLAFHGSNQTGARLRSMVGRELDGWARDGLGAVLYPDSFRHGLWNDGRSSTKSKARAAGVDDVAFVHELLTRVRPLEAPVFIVGYSNGGQLVIRLLHETKDDFAAAALVGATMPAPGYVLFDEHVGRPVPVLMVHGTKDRIVPYEGGMATLFGFRPRGEMRSFTDSADYWVRRNGLDVAPSVTELPQRTASAALPATELRYEAEGRPSVILYSVSNGGHVFPNRIRRAPRVLGRSTPGLDAPQVILDWFATFLASTSAR